MGLILSSTLIGTVFQHMMGCSCGLEMFMGFASLYLGRKCVYISMHACISNKPHAYTIVFSFTFLKDFFFLDKLENDVSVVVLSRKTLTPALLNKEAPCVFVTVCASFQNSSC